MSGKTIWLTGLSSAGKTTIARAVEKRLLDQGRKVEVLDGDVVRNHLSKDLGFSRADRDDNVRRIGFVADLLSRNGVVVLCSVISPYRDVRDELRQLHSSPGQDGGGDDRFVEVYVSTPVEICSQRDVKGLYAKQRAGEIAGLTGVDDPYEAPLAPEVTVPTHELSLDQAVELVLGAVG